MEGHELNLSGVPVLPQNLLVRTEDNDPCLLNIPADILTAHFTDTRENYHPSQLALFSRSKELQCNAVYLSSIE